MEQKHKAEGEAEAAQYTLRTAFRKVICSQTNTSGLFGEKHMTYSEAQCLRLCKQHLTRKVTKQLRGNIASLRKTYPVKKTILILHLLNLVSK